MPQVTTQTVILKVSTCWFCALERIGLALGQSAKIRGTALGLSLGGFVNLVSLTFQRMSCS